jgi:hypothetical protein
MSFNHSVNRWAWQLPNGDLCRNPLGDVITAPSLAEAQAIKQIHETVVAVRVTVEEIPAEPHSGRSEVRRLMDSNRIIIAEEAARRFLARADHLQKVALAACIQGKDCHPLTPLDHYLTTGTKESGALRRASMDLTRALAELRKSS